MIFVTLKTSTRINLIIQCIGMLIGTTTHVLWIIHNGFLSEKYHAPIFSGFFWDSLTFLDPLAAMMLIWKPRIGIWMTAIIITVDVLHNGSLCFSALWSEQEPLISWIKHNWMLWCQLLFGLFVLCSFKSNLSDVAKQEDV